MKHEGKKGIKLIIHVGSLSSLNKKFAIDERRMSTKGNGRKHSEFPRDFRGRFKGSERSVEEEK